MEPENIAIGSTFITTVNDPILEKTTATCKQGHKYTVTRRVPRTKNIVITVTDRIVETRDSGSVRVFYELRYNMPAIGDSPAKTTTYMVPLESPLWNTFSAE